jgi:fructokinase
VTAPTLDYRKDLLGAVEAGGTKFICAVGTSSGALIDQTRIPTGAPVETMDGVVSFFRGYSRDLAAIGIGSFGPIGLQRGSPAYGHITSTPKIAWRNFDIVGTIQRAFDAPVAFDTDVNAAALAEARWGAAKGCQTILYVTVGTGVGGGLIAEGKVLHGLMHPEMGHIRVPHEWASDPFAGVCPYHGDCLEGLASGTAIEARWGAAPSTLEPGHVAFRSVAEYLALACTTWICTLSPEKIVFGGGVMQPHMFPLLRDRTRSLLNGYIQAPEILENIESYIVPPGLGSRAGAFGALALAAEAAGLG